MELALQLRFFYKPYNTDYFSFVAGNSTRFGTVFNRCHYLLPEALLYFETVIPIALFYKTLPTDRLRFSGYTSEEKYVILRAEPERIQLFILSLMTGEDRIS